MDKEFIKSNISAAAAEAAAHGATLCAVIKTRTNEEIDFAVRECGVRVVGENRVQELLEHYPTLDAAGAEIHFIGHLQKNKVKYVVGKISMIESLDSIPLAAELEKHLARTGITLDALVEINIGREAQKSGVMPEELGEFLDALASFPHINVRGLMTVAPKCEDLSDYDAYFAQTKKLFDTVFKEKCKNVSSPVLSMGMSESYGRALAHGSTEIRLGTKLFGERSYAPKM